MTNKTKTTCLTEEQCKIRDAIERNNAKAREELNARKLPTAEQLLMEC